MADFSYTARTHTGAIQHGNLSASDQTAAAALLSDRGLVPIMIKARGGGGGGNMLAKLHFGSKVKLADKVVFSRQLATMINAGVPITQALNILREQTTNTYFQKVIVDCAKQVEGGAPISTALAAHSDVFSPIYINMIKAGEAGGMLDEVLDRLALQQEKDAAVVSKIRGAMVYPCLLLTATTGAFIFLMTYLVPHMAGIFASLGSNLPWYSQLMLTISSILLHYGLVLLAAVIALGVVGWRSIHTPAGKRLADRLLLRLPLIGPIIIKVNVARFVRTFGSLMSSGISVLDALSTTAGGLGNTVFQDSLHDLARAVKAGKSLSGQLKTVSVFPPIVSQMMAVGEETGQLDTILLKLAGFYEAEVDTVIGSITTVIEPIMLLVLGGMVGFVVIGVFGPLASLNGAI
jgi:type IV pilus assembly protein PilC